MTSTWKIADTGKGVVFPPLCSHQSLIAFGWLPNRVTQLKVIQVTKSQHTHVASGCCLKIMNIKRRDGETGRTCSLIIRSCCLHRLSVRNKQLQSSAKNVTCFALTEKQSRISCVLYNRDE